MQSSKRAILNSKEALQSHETVMRNFLDLFERATFSKEGSAQDEHLKAWMEYMQKIGSEKLFTNLTTAAKVNELMRVLLRERRMNGTTLDISVVWDQVRASMHQVVPELRLWMRPSSC